MNTPEFDKTINNIQVEKNVHFLESPREVELILTSKCNLKCLHCGVAGISFRGELGYNDWQKIIKQLEDARVFFVQLNGGEIFLLSYIFDIIEELGDRGITIRLLNTNATLIDNEKIKKLKSLLNENVNLLISLDGHNAEIHDALRGKGAFTKAVRGYTLISEAGFKPSVFCVVNKLNYNTIPKIIEKTLSLNAKNIVLNPISNVGRARLHPKLQLNRTELIEAAKQIQKAMQNTPKNFIQGSFVRIAESILNSNESKQLDDTDGRFWVCPKAFTECTITPSGRLTLCDLTLEWGGELLIGPEGKSLIYAWQNSSLLTKARKAFGIPLFKIGECSQCARKDRCQGVCPAISSIRKRYWPYIKTSDCLFFQKPCDVTYY